MAEPAIRVLTFNAGWLRYPLDSQLCPIEGASDLVPYVAERFDAFPSAFTTLLKQYPTEIIVLQEVYETALAKATDRFFSGLGYRTLWPHRKDPSRMYPSGLMVAVKGWHIRKAEFYPFGDSARAGNEKLLDNGALFAELKKGNSHLLLAAVHLQALAVDRSGKATKPEEVAAFEKQVALTKEKMSQWGRKNLPLLVVGDFNAGPILGGEPYKKLLDGLDLKSAFFARDIPQAFNATWDQKNKLVAEGDFATDPSDMIDHVLFSERAFVVQEARVVLKDVLPEKPYPLSDHYGLLADLQPRR
ncbi:MAG: hypothetical protein KDD51_04840 [Bdellovibrionales bacterium]|nr:hypothetical protein [Bdellovibrionales bacterium]